MARNKFKQAAEWLFGFGIGMLTVLLIPMLQQRYPDLFGAQWTIRAIVILIALTVSPTVWSFANWIRSHTRTQLAGYKHLSYLLVGVRVLIIGTSVATCILAVLSVDQEPNFRVRFKQSSVCSSSCQVKIRNEIVNVRHFLRSIDVSLPSDVPVVGIGTLKQQELNHSSAPDSGVRINLEGKDISYELVVAEPEIDNVDAISSLYIRYVITETFQVPLDASDPDGACTHTELI